MAVRYGVNILASDMRDWLEENDRQQSGVRSWKQLFGNAALGYNAQSDALKTDYASTIADAYKANFERQNAVLGAGLNAGATGAFLADNRNDLLTAYDSYVRNYQSDVSALAKNYANEVGTYDEALDQRAKNFASLYNKAYDYLSQELNGAYQTFGEGDKQTTVDFFTDQGLDWMRNDAGVLKSWNELSYDLFDNDTGELTDAGRDFYNRIFNGVPQAWMRDVDDTNSDVTKRAVRSFDEWLSDTDADLREWWASQDEFAVGGINKDTALKRLGIDKMDTPNLSKKTDTETPATPTEELKMQTDDSHVPWVAYDLGNGRKSGKNRSDRFTLIFNPVWTGESHRGTTYAVKTVDNVTEELAKKLNTISTGGETTSPSTKGEGALLRSAIDSTHKGKSNKIVHYDNKLYIYTKNGWREIQSRDKNVSTDAIVKAFLKQTE